MSNEVEWREWDLRGCEVTQLCFYSEILMVLWSEWGNLQVTFGSTFTFHSADGLVREIEPGKNETLVPLLSLLNRPAMSFHASSTGRRRLRFAGGCEIACEPDPQYEAWGSHGSGSLAEASLLSSPGGGLPWPDPNRSL